MPESRDSDSDSDRDSGSGGGSTSYRYLILVDDNYGYQDEDKRYTHSEVHDPLTALSVARRIVDECLRQLYKPGMTAEQLYSAYTSFGEDPFINTDDPRFARFSAWSYAKQQCPLVCSASGDQQS